MHLAFSKQSLVGVTFLRVHRQNDQASRFTVNAVNWAEGVDTEFFFQLHQQTAAHIPTGRRHGHEVGFVGHYQMRVSKQHLCFEGEFRLLGDATVIVNQCVGGVRGCRIDRFALRIEYQAIRKARGPFLWGYCGEALAEEVENG